MILFILSKNDIKFFLWHVVFLHLLFWQSFWGAPRCIPFEIFIWLLLLSLVVFFTIFRPKIWFLSVLWLLVCTSVILSDSI
jgi:hypothetical protein